MCLPIPGVRALCAATILSLFSAPVQAASQRSLELEDVAFGFQSITAIAAPHDGSGRLFIAEQAGLVHIIEDGVVQPQPFLDLTASTNAFVEQGLLGLAFHPNYAANGWVFVHYTNLNGHSRVVRYTVSSTNPNRVDYGTKTTVINVDQPDVYHNGGCLAFGPDGYLYIGFGDGGGANASANSSDGSTFLGKMLRLDVSAPPYQIPPSNPFVGNPGVRDEIWALGLRNPWRFSFDRESGDFWIADVGEMAWEEVDFEAAGSAGGAHYGWDTMEGSACFKPSTGCNQTGLTLPFYEYDHGASFARCSITGGFVYRGQSMATMHGRYFFADFCSGQIWSVRRDASGAPVDLVDHSTEFGVVGTPTTFGEDEQGELYVGGINGRVSKLVPAGFRLEVDPAVAGTTVPIRVTGGVPSTRVVAIFSFQGPGSTWVPRLGSWVDLSTPRFAFKAATDLQGELGFSGIVPAYLSGMTVWMQAWQAGSLSNVVTQTIE